MEPEIYDLGPVAVEGGVTLPSLKLAYQTHGTLNADKSNVVVFPTWFGGQHASAMWIIGPDHPLDPAKYFIVVINIIGNGQSSSPSNTPAPFDGPRFPYVSVLDNVKAQRRLLAELFGIEKIHLVIGRSMGAQLAFHWGAYYPEMVERILPFVGSAKTSIHNWIFLENVKGAITTDPAWLQGEYKEPLAVASRRMRLVFDSWGVSQSFYRQKLHLAMGFPTTRAYLDRDAPVADGNNVLAQCATWQGADISNNEKYGGDVFKALAGITAKAIVMPSRTDLYFPPEDSEIEVAHMPHAELRVIPSVWGHRAGAPGTDPVDIAFVDAAVRDILAA
jgi:homoserine O-acetyltransferase